MKEVMIKKMEARGYKVWNNSRIYLNFGNAYFDLDKEKYVYGEDEAAEIEALIENFKIEEEELLENLQTSFTKFDDMLRRKRRKYTLNDFLERNPSMTQDFAGDYDILRLDGKVIAVEFTANSIEVI